MSSEMKFEARTFDEVFEVVSDRGARVKQKDYLESGLIPIVDQGEAFIGGYTNEQSYLVASELPLIVFGDHTRRVKLVQEPFAVGADGVKLLKPKHGWNPRFLWYQFAVLDLPDRGYSRHFQFLRKAVFKYVPYKQQQILVESLDEIFSDLEAGIASLTRAQATLKRYRASLLSAAVDGNLTADWRAKNPFTESGEQLLARILKVRREKWTADQLAKFSTRGKLPAKNWHEKYSEPTSPDVSSMPELPQGWCWASADQLAEIQSGIQKQPKRTPKENHFPYLRVANVLRGRLDLAEIERFELFDGELEKLKLEGGDLLIVEGNGSPNEIGRSALWNDEILDCVHQNHLIRVRPILLSSAYMDFYWNSPLGRRLVKEKAASTSGLYTLSVSKVGGILVPLPPLDEQLKIVEIVDNQLAFIDHTQALIDKQLKRARRLSRAILKAAFEGKLVGKIQSTVQLQKVA
jgi:type I restriction enzyme, S subunit